MAARYHRNTAILAKIEATYGTDATPTEAANALLVSNVSINPLNAQNVSRDLIRPFLGGSEQLVGAANIELSFDVELAGAGAAGGMGGGVLLLPDARLQAGVKIVMEAVKLAEKVQDADLVITGEGRMDAQSVHGKTPIGVAHTAKAFGKPVIAIVGCLREDYEVVYAQGIDAVFPIIRQLGSLEEILQHGRDNLVSAAQNVARIYQMGISRK